MIDLSVQLKLIFFSFIFGFLFSIVLDEFNKLIKKYKNVLQFFLSFILITIVTVIYYIGIQKIDYAVFHFYSPVSMLI